MTKRKLPAPLVELMARGWVPPNELDAAAVSGAAHHRSSRDAVSRAASQTLAGQTLIIPAGLEKSRNNDVDTIALINLAASVRGG